MLTLLAVCALPLVATAGPPSTSRFFGTGFGVVGVIHHTDEAGVETIGYVFGANILHGQHPDVPFDQAVVFAGERYYPDLGYSVPFLGAGEATYAGRGLQGGDVVGTITAQPFYDGSNLPPEPLPDLVIDIDLTWSGTGSTNSSVSHYAAGNPGESYVFVESSRWRYANVSGTASVVGSDNPASVDTAQVLADTAAEFNLVVIH